MSDGESLRQAIIANPKDDTVRLVYADWLEENGDAAHAELIRIQCELASRSCSAARKKELASREKELLSTPRFHTPGERSWAYERGFVAENCFLFRTGGLQLFTEPRLSVKDFGVGGSGRPQPLSIPLGPENVGLLDLVLDLNLEVSELGGVPRKADPLLSACLRRVTHLNCHDYGSVSPRWLSYLAASPDLFCLSSTTVVVIG
jgi:uncharacterized protein (TIGR02996 family)